MAAGVHPSPGYLQEHRTQGLEGGKRGSQRDRFQGRDISNIGNLCADSWRARRLLIGRLKACNLPSGQELTKRLQLRYLPAPRCSPPHAMPRLPRPDPTMQQHKVPQDLASPLRLHLRSPLPHLPLLHSLHQHLLPRRRQYLVLRHHAVFFGFHLPILRGLLLLLL